MIDIIRKRLGRPYFESEDVLLYHGDSIELMGELSGCEIPLTVTSPPYNIGKEYERTMPIEDYKAWSKTSSGNS